MTDLMTELNWAYSGLNNLFTTQGSTSRVGLGDLLMAIAQGAAGEVTSFNGRTGAVVPTSGDYTTTLVAEGSNLYFTQPRVLATALTGYVSAPGTITSADTVLSAIEKLNGNQQTISTDDLHVDGSNDMNGNILFSPDDSYSIGNTTTLRPATINTRTINAGIGSGESGFINLGDQSLLTQLAAASGALTITVNNKNSLAFDGQGNIAFNTTPTLAASPFFSFGVDGAAILGGYPSPAVRTQYRPGYMTVKHAIGIGTGAGETGAIQLGDYTKGNIIYGNSDGSMNLWLNNLKMLFIDNSGNWWLDQDVSGATPAMIFTQDDYRSIGATSTTFRPSKVWVAQTVGIGLASGQSGTLQMGVGGAQLVGDTSGNINVTLGASGSLNMNSKKITGLAAGVNPTDAVNVSQLTGGGLSGVTGQVAVFNSSTTATGYTGFTSDTSGNVVTNTIKSGAGTVSAAGVQVGNSGGTGLWSSTGNTLDFTTNGIDRWQVPASFALQVPAITSGTGTSGNAATISGQNQSVASATANGGALTIQAGLANGTGSTGNGGALSLLGGTTVGGVGGAVAITAANGSNVGAGAAGGNINIQAGQAQGDNSQNNNGGSISITAGASKGSASGGGVNINAGNGGLGTGTAGASGSQIVLTGGTGGAGSATSGAGGNVDCFAGSGGGGVAGGNGGTAQLAGGTAGTGSASGGNGGAANISGGSAAGFVGSAGGSVTVAGGGGTGTGSGGAGGSVTINGGAAGGDSTVNRNGGGITITCGNSKGSANGSQLTLNSGVGGIGTGTTGANGGNIVISANAGGVGSATGGTGGSVQINAGNGGNSSTPGSGGDIQFYTSTTTSSVERFRVSHTNLIEILQTGNGLGITHGTNCKLGTSDLSSGTVTVSNTAVTSNSIIFLSVKTASGTLGSLSIGTVTAGTSFVINSSSGSDASTVAWLIIEGL